MTPHRRRVAPSRAPGGIHAAVLCCAAALALHLAGGVAGASRAAVSPEHTAFPKLLPPGPALAAPDPGDTVSTGCMGGKTGGGTGMLLTAQGAILSWHQATFAPPREYHLLQVDTAATTAVFRELERLRFRTIKYDKPDNVTCTLELTGPGGRHSVSWPLGAPPPMLDAVIRRIHMLYPDG